MLVRRIAAALIVLVGFAGPAQAAHGRIDMSWNSCAPTATDLPSIAPGTPEVSLWVTVTGLDQPHKGYLFQTLYGNSRTQTVPDAWQFDLLGCQSASQVQLDHTLSKWVAKTCPPLMGTITPNFQIKQLLPNDSALSLFDPTLMHIVIANAYPNAGAGNTTQIDPAVRYFLGRIRSDHTYSVNGPTNPKVDCGGLDEPMCFALIGGSYVSPADVEEMFGLDGVRGLTVGSVAGCPTTPAKNATWGQIKSRYRM